MNCDEYRKQKIFTDGEKNLPEELRLHLAGCPECQAYLREDQRLRKEVRKLAENEHAPEALQSSIAARSHHPRLRNRQSKRRWVPAAAVILLAVGAGATYSFYHRARQPSPERLAEEFINDHLHYLPGREQIVSGSPQEVEGWFQGRVEFTVHVPDVPDAALQDARICDISGRKAALLHYHRNRGDALISVFVAEEPKSLEQQMRSGTLVASSQGLNSTLWCRRGLVYDVVGALDDATLQQIAESVRKQEP